MLDEGAIESVAGEGLGVAYDDEFHACAGHGDVHAAQVAEEADAAVSVVAHQ